MKKFIDKVQDLSQKAAQVRQAIQGAPAKAAEFREAVTAAAGQLHQLRADVHASINGLRTEGDDRLTQTLREIDQSHDLFRQAGYAVEEVEMELGLAQRIVVHLAKLENVPHHHIQSLLSTLDSRRATHAVLTALLKAEELAEKVELTHLTYHKLTVYAGLTPSVRLCWGVEWQEPATRAAAPVAVGAPVASAPPPPLPSPSAFTQSTYFERATPAAVPAAAAPAVPAPAASAGLAGPKPAPEPQAPVSSAGDFGRSALERFKKMPDLSKYRR